MNNQKVPKKIRKFEEYLRKRIKQGITNTRKLFHELHEQGYKGSHSSLYKYIRSLKQGSFKSYKPSIHVETKPGEQAQVDWGHFGKIEINGKAERLYCFVYVLCFSRALYIEFTVKQNLATLKQCHIHAFEKLGITKTIVYDNMKTVVLSREKSSDGESTPHFNPAFVHFAQFYDFAIKACHPYWPRAKGKVEAGVKFVRNNFMQGMKFKRDYRTLEELNEKAQQWLHSVANVRQHKITEKKPIELWGKEKPFLRFPKGQPYNTSLWSVRYSTKDGLIHYKSNFYSVPHEFSRRKLLVEEISNNGAPLIKIYHEGKFITSHILSKGRKNWIVKDEHFISKELRRIPKPKIIIRSRSLSYYSQFIQNGE